MPASFLTAAESPLDEDVVRPETCRASSNLPSLDVNAVTSQP